MFPMFWFLSVCNIGLLMIWNSSFRNDFWLFKANVQCFRNFGSSGRIWFSRIFGLCSDACIKESFSSNCWNSHPTMNSVKCILSFNQRIFFVFNIHLIFYFILYPDLYATNWTSTWLVNRIPNRWQDSQQNECTSLFVARWEI